MRRITAALLLTFCLVTGEIAHAQNQKQAGEPQQPYRQQPTSQNGAKQNNKDTNRNKQENRSPAKEKQAAQSTCVPDPRSAGEGDPDAPQNHVEYGGGG